MVVGISATTIMQNDKLFEITKNIEIFANVYQQLNTKFVDELDPSILMRTGIDAMMNSLDPYTVYYSESQVESYRLSDEGKYQGFGAILDVMNDYITVKEVYENGAAQEAGINAGDQIIAINGLNTEGKSLEDVNAISKGVAGSTVNLKIRRAITGNIDEVTLTRTEVNIPNVPYSGRVADNIGYISLTVFTQNASANIIEALDRLKKEDGLEGLVLDLRHNGGGLLREAVDICNIFIPADMEVVTTKGKVKDRDRTFKTTKPVVDPNIPIVVLTDGRSASASEIVSGVLQDYDRAVIMGQRTYGKGLVQNTEEVGYNSRIKLTTSKYYIPSRRCIQAVEYENGEPVNIADERRSKFKTANGRTVLDGGGITPDVRLDPKENSEFTKALMDQNIIFEFVNKYVSTRDSIAEPRAFSFTQYEDFKSFVANSDFNFESKVEKELKKLMEESHADVKDDFKALQKKIDLEQSDDLEQYKEEIIKEIELDIISRYYYQSGKAKHKLNGDSEIQEAIQLLNDQERYNKILGN